MNGRIGEKGRGRSKLRFRDSGTGRKEDSD